MGEITREQAIQLLDLLLNADVTGHAVQALIDRFDLIETMMKYPESVRRMNPALFETFVSGGIVSAGVALQGPARIEDTIVSEYGYPAGWRLKGIEQQLLVLEQFFPGLTFEAEVPASLPGGAEGWLLVPKPSRIARSYNEALQRLLSLGTSARPRFLNSRDGRLGLEHLRLTEETGRVLHELERSTPGDYLVLAVQCGQQHRAKSVSQARTAYGEKEFGLGPFEVACLLITHPDRLADYEHLGIDCPGCEYATTPGGDFAYSLCFTWGEEGLYLDCSTVAGAAPGFGSASGFLG